MAKDYKPVDYKCVSINVDGHVNGKENQRCEANPREDGFVFNTVVEKIDGKYNYANDVIGGPSSQTEMMQTSINGSVEEGLNAALYRGAERNEATINANFEGTQFNGNVTQKMLYNEGLTTNRDFTDLEVTNPTEIGFMDKEQKNLRYDASLREFNGIMDVRQL